MLSLFTSVISGCGTVDNHRNGHEGTVDNTGITAELHSRLCCRQHNGHQIVVGLFRACHVRVQNLLILVSFGKCLRAWLSKQPSQRSFCPYATIMEWISEDFQAS